MTPETMTTEEILKKFKLLEENIRNTLRNMLSMGLEDAHAIRVLSEIIQSLNSYVDYTKFRTETNTVAPTTSN